MTIRVTCDQCGSVLKIKDELAGTDGKCPKCKTRFVVPSPSTEAPVKNSGAAELTETSDDLAPVSDPIVSAPAEAVISPKAAAKTPVKGSEKPVPKTPEKPSKKPVEDEEFDPVSFLMDGPKKKPTLDTTPEPASRSPMAGGSPSRNGGGGFSLDDDSAPDQEYDKPAPTRKWGAKKDSSAATAADRSLGGSTNAAKDLLAKSMEESRVRASEMPEEEPRFSFDFAGLFREIGVKGFGSVAGVIVALLGVWWMMDNMMGSKIKLPRLGYVSGTVTSGGKPVAGVKVYFSPLDRTIEGANEKKERARDSMGFTDAEGQFVLYYSEETEGVKVGKCRVWMEASDPGVVIPQSYGMGSIHTVEVKSGTNPPQKLEL